MTAHAAVVLFYLKLRHPDKSRFLIAWPTSIAMEKTMAPTKTTISIVLTMLLYSRVMM